MDKKPTPLLIFSTLDPLRGQAPYERLLQSGESIQSLIDKNVLTFEWPMGMERRWVSPSPLCCPTCRGHKWIDDGTLTYGGYLGHIPCRTCGATGVYVSRTRAGLADE